jgi:hypothetical protein
MLIRYKKHILSEMYLIVMSAVAVMHVSVVWEELG